MLNATEKAELQTILGSSLQDTSCRFAGVCLSPEGTCPSAELSDDTCTVQTTFRGGCRADLALCADTALFARLARNVMGAEAVTQQDIRDVATEYFNIVCGRVAAGLFRTSRIAPRFQIPSFRPGLYLPQEQPAKLCVLKFHCTRQEHIHLICACPGTGPGE